MDVTKKSADVIKKVGGCHKKSRQMSHKESQRMSLQRPADVTRRKPADVIKKPEKHRYQSSMLPPAELYLYILNIIYTFCKVCSFLICRLLAGSSAFAPSCTRRMFYIVPRIIPHQAAVFIWL